MIKSEFIDESNLTGHAFPVGVKAWTRKAQVERLTT
jgi:hypothetical protein